MTAILQIIPTLDSGGAERTTLEMTRAIVEAGGRALVATSGGRLVGDIEAAGGEIVLMPVQSKNPAVIFENGFRLARLIRQRRVDLIDVRSRAPAWSALFAARRTGVRLIGTYHGAYRARSPLKRLYNSGMVRGDLVIANSEFTAEAIRAQYDLRGRPLLVIPRGADLERFDPATISLERRQALADAWDVACDESGAPRDLLFILPARPTGWKGHDVTIAALAQVAGSGARFAQNLQVAFVGGAGGKSSFATTLEREISRQGVGGMVKFVGHCDDMPAAYSLADVVLSPSTLPEAFGRVAAEAGAMERIVIGSDHGGQRETIVAGETGFLVAPGDPAALGAAIVTAARYSPAERLAMGRAARRRISERYSTAAMCRATLAAYATALARSGAGDEVAYVRA